MNIYWMHVGSRYIQKMYDCEVMLFFLKNELKQSSEISGSFWKQFKYFSI